MSRDRLDPETGDADDRIERYFAGEALYGDDFDEAEILAWYRDEESAYADLGAKESAQYRYVYHALNWEHGFRHIAPEHRIGHALGFGSAWAEEFRPLASRLDRLTIVEPGDVFAREVVHGVPTRYVKPDPSGTLPFEDEPFDLETSFGALHHIPNVSHVVGELHRCARRGGFALIHEPIVTMGDWRKPRPGLTRRERGIPLRVLRDIVHRAGFRIERERLIGFPLVPRLMALLGQPPYNSGIAVALDRALCALTRWNLRYHATGTFDKLRPTGVFLVLRRPPEGDSQRRSATSR